jgi:hypothetical protein
MLHGAGSAGFAILRWLSCLVACAGMLSLAAAPVATIFAETAVPVIEVGWWCCWAASLAGLLHLAWHVWVSGAMQATFAALVALLGRLHAHPPAAPALPAGTAAAAEAPGSVVLPAATAAGVASAPVAAPSGCDAAGSGQRCLLVSTSLAPAPPSAGPAHGVGVAASRLAPHTAGIDLGVLQQLLHQHQRGAPGAARSTQGAAVRSSLYVSSKRRVFVGAKVWGSGG